MKRLEREQIVGRARAVLPALVSLGALVVMVLSTSAVTADKPVEENGPAMTTTQPVHTNHLSRATSPYLLLHAHNPVDWYEWGPEAFARARAENKPIFLSIGYAACHWCHVMAHESFEDPDIAAVLNKSFINIKVDREERPDIDELYMQATLVLNQGQGGWPMSVWLTPDRKPFHAGTYFPPTACWGRPGFMELCAAIGEAWQRRRDEIVTQADKLTSVVRESLKATGGEVAELTDEIVTQTADTLAGAFDAQRGGMLSGGSNKFPPSMALDVMLRAAAARPSGDRQRKRLMELVELTLDRMATGGIYDQLGGGIHRYSVDPEWHVPHFEKMLYDQALVSRAYVDAYQLTRKPLYARVAREIFDYAMTDLQLSDGGFGSARDADSAGREGEYYVWTRAEVLATLGKAAGELFCSFYDVSEAGNWNDPHEPGRPKNILHAPRDLATVAKLNGSAPAESARQLEAARPKLLAVRAQRVPPALDDKILCEWNGLMIASLARGGCVLGQPRYIAAAARAANFILDKQYKDGRLQRSYRAGRTLETAFLSDYACLIEGLLELYEATFDPYWLKQARELNETVIKHFWDDRDGGFFFTADDHEELVMRRKDVRDGAVPSGNAVQVMNLLRLSVMLGDQRLREMADKTLSALAGPVRETPWASERFLAAVDFAREGPVEIAIVGNPLKPETRALLKQVYATYLPNRVLMLRNPDQPGDDLHVPLLAGRTLIDGRPAAYICRNFACQRPATTPDELAAELSCSTAVSRPSIATRK